MSAWNRKLTDSDVQEIRSFVDEGWTQFWHGAAAIALAYGTTASYVRGIGSREARWKVPEACVREGREKGD